MESVAELVRFGEDVYGFRWLNHVSLFIVTDEGVILVDPIGQVNPRTPSVLKEAVRSVSEQPVRRVIYSHWGADHGMGGEVFADTAQFIGHRRAAEKIALAADPGSPVPRDVVDGMTTVELGGKQVVLYPAETSETDDYLIIHYPAGRLAMYVDFMQPANVPYGTLLGHPDRIVERLQWMHDTLDFDVVVSGHASPRMTGTKADVLEQRQYYLDLSDAIDAARGSGHGDGSPEMAEAVRGVLEGRYGGWRRFDEFLRLNIEGMIAKRGGEYVGRMV